jgi:hypothetical protein
LLEAVRDAAPVPVCLLPGTHDRFSHDSVYRRPEFTGSGPQNLHVFTQDGPQTFPFRDLGLAVHGRANLVNQGGESPLKDVRPSSEARFNIAIAHASIPLASRDLDDEHDYLVRPEDAEASGMDYIALGHWHRFQECFSGTRARVFYPGSPECLDFDGAQAIGSCAVVSLSQGRVEVQRETCGRYLWRAFEVDLAAEDNDRRIRTSLDDCASPSTILRLVAVGRPVAYYRVPIDDLEEEYAGRFAHLQLRDSTSRAQDPGDYRTAFIANSIGGFFCQLVEQRLQEGPPGERKRWEEVRRRGAALLLGKEEVRS